VAQVNGVWVYKVNREGRIINSPVDNVVVKDTPSRVAREAPAPSGKVDTSMQATAKEFSARLVRTGGRLIDLTSTGQKISARWTSAKCDNFEPDVIDLLLSVSRTG